MKYYISWQDQFGKWQRYTTKTNEADAFRVMKNKAKSDGRIILADEISPDSCRLWDQETEKKLDKDRFRKDLGDIIEAYQEVARRLGILHEQSNIRPIKFPKPTAVKIKKNK